MYDFIQVNGQYSWTLNYMRKLNGRLLVPAGEFFKALGAGVTWHSDTTTLLALHSHRLIKVVVGSAEAEINGVRYTMTSPAALSDSSVYVPLDFAVDALGAVMERDAINTADIRIRRQPGPPETAEKATVKQVIDATTVLLNSGQKAKLIGVEVPKVDESTAAMTLAFAQKHLPNAVVYLEWDDVRKDAQGTLLAYVWLSDGQLWNAVLVREGLAQASLEPPNLKYAESLVKLYLVAWERKIGLWQR